MPFLYIAALINHTMNKYLKEAIWFFVPVALSALLTLLSFGTSIFSEDIIINVHDTYYVIAPLHFITLVAIFLGFFTSLFRALYYRFKNRISNYIFFFYGIIFITLLLWAISSSGN